MIARTFFSGRNYVYNGKLAHNDKEMNIWKLLFKKIQK